MKTAGMIGLLGSALLLGWGCGGSATRMASHAALDFENEKKEISETPGDATGSDRSGTYDVTIQTAEGKRECWGSPAVRKKMESGPLPADAALECTQTDAFLECKYEKFDLTVKGYLKKTGEFKTHGKFSRKDPDGKGAARGEVILGASFQDADKFAGRFRAKALRLVGGNSALCTYDYPVTGTRQKKNASATRAQTTAPKASLELVSGEKTLARNFTDIRVRKSGDNVEVGGKAGEGERFTAVLKPDGTADLSMKLIDTGGVTAHEGPVADCIYTAAPESPDRVILRCPRVRGQLVLPDGTL